MGFRPACLTNRTHIRTLLLGSGRVGFGLDDLVVTSPAGVRPQRPMSDPPRSEKASEAGPFPLPASACAPVRSAGCVGSHGPAALVPVSGRRRPPLPTCRVCSHARRPRASVQRRLTEHNGHGWMDHGWMRPSKIPGRSRVVTGHAAVTCVLRGVGEKWKSAARGCATARDATQRGRNSSPARIRPPVCRGQVDE